MKLTRQFSIRTLLSLILMAAAGVGVVYPMWQFNAKKRYTLGALDKNGGPPGETEMRESAITAINKMTAFSPTQPKLISVRTQESETGYLVTAYWVGHRPVADGLEINFTGGESVTARFTSVMIDNSFDGYDGLLFYWASILDESLPERFQATIITDVTSARLTKGSSPCSSFVDAEPY